MSVINPKTNRKVSTNTRVFKNLLKEFTLENNILVPKNKTNYGFSKVKNHWILNSKIPKSYENKDNIITLKEGLVKAPTGRYIKKDGRAFKKFLNLGYQFKKNIFIKPEISYDISSSDYKSFNFDKNRLNNAKQIIIITFDGEKLYVDMTKKDFIQAINEKTYDEDNFIIKVIESAKVKFGVAYDGVQNCFIKCIKEHIINQKNHYKKSDKAKERLEKKFNEYFEEFEEGVFENDIQKIAEDWKLLIRIYESDEYEEYGKKEYIKHKTLLKLEYKNNHVELKEEQIEIKKEIITINNKYDWVIDNLSFDNEDHNITSYLKDIDVNDIEEIQLDNDNIVKLSTKDKIYKYQYATISSENEDLDIKLEDYEFTLNDKAFNDLFNYFTIKPQPIKTNCKEVKEIINPIYFQLQNIEANKEYINLDIKSAYSNFNELPTDLLIKCNTNKMHEQIGFYYITLTCPIRKINISEWHSTEYLNVLNKHNIEYSIEQAMLSSTKTNLNINEFNIKYNTHLPKYKRIFHKILGKFQKYQHYKRYLTTDYEICRKYGGHELLNIKGTTIYEYSSNKLVNSINRYYPHITGYIMENTHSKILDTILTFKLNPLRIWADNIIIDKSTKLSKIPEIFHIDYNYSYKENIIISYKTNNDLKLDINNDYYHIHPEDFVLGPAGTGKTTIIKNQYIPYINVLILSPTNMALKNFKEFKNKMTITNYLENNHKHLYRTELIIIDEISMVSQETYDLIKNKSKCKVISFGDFNQLQPVQGKPINYKQYQYTVLTNIYRQEDKIFQQYTLETLKTGSVKYIKNKLSIEECIKNNTLILSARNNQIDNINKIGYQLNQSQIINETFKVNSPIIIIKNDMKHNGLVNGDYGYIKSYDGTNIIINIADDNYTLSIDELNKNVKPAYSITYHKVQGQTFDKSICLNIKKLNQQQKNNMLYVGVSRVRKLEQLFLLNLT